MKFSVQNVKRGMVIARTALIKNSPYILTGIGVCGVVSTAVSASKATLRAESILNAHKHEIWEKEHQPAWEPEDITISPTEALKLTWKCYIPTVLMGTASIACIVGAQAISSKRQAMLAGLYSASELALREYQDKVVDIFGDEGQKKITDGLAKDAMEKNPVSSSDVFVTGSGTTLCYDTHTGSYFYGDIEKIRKAQNDINEQIMLQSYGEMSQNDFFYLLGRKSVREGDIFGWTTENPLKVVFSSQIADDGRPCIVIDYDLYLLSDSRNCPF